MLATKTIGLWLGLCAMHALLIAFPIPSLAPAVAATVYAPLAALKVIGIPTFATTSSGGWPAPSWLGWSVLALLWGAIWWALAMLLRTIASKRRT